MLICGLYAKRNVIIICKSVLSVPTIAYVLKNMTADAKRSIIRSLAGIVNILPANSEHVSDMLDGTMHDIEDTLQVQSATEGSCDLIVTRNVKDFHPCPLPVISPAEFLKRVLA